MHALLLGDTLATTPPSASAITHTFLAALAPKTSSASSFTWAGESLGATDANRWIILTLNYRTTSGASLSGVTIGGVSATVVSHSNDSDGSPTVAVIAAANVPSGTTADIVATFSANVNRIGGGKIRALGLKSATPDDTATSSTSVNGDPSVTIDKYAGGLVVASQYYASNTGVVAQRVSGASIATASAEAGATVSAVNTDANTAWSGVSEDYDQELASGIYCQQALLVASWSPS